MNFGQQLRSGLGTGLLFLALLVGIQVSFLLAQVSGTLSAWNDAAMRMDHTAQETLLTAQSVLSSVRGTTEQVRRSAEHQLGYYEAVGRRTSNLIAEMTFLIRNADERLEELTRATNALLQNGAAATAEAGKNFGSVTDQAGSTLAESERLITELRETAAAPEVRGSLEAIEASAKNLATATAEAAEASRNTAEATGYIRDMLSPTKKSFWRKLFELLIPRPAIAVR
jgi:hypothetical protein